MRTATAVKAQPASGGVAAVVTVAPAATVVEVKVRVRTVVMAIYSTLFKTSETSAEKTGCRGLTLALVLLALPGFQATRRYHMQ